MIIRGDADTANSERSAADAGQGLMPLPEIICKKSPSAHTSRAKRQRMRMIRKRRQQEQDRKKQVSA